jgi:hypothetical protein
VNCEFPYRDEDNDDRANAIDPGAPFLEFLVIHHDSPRKLKPKNATSKLVEQGCRASPLQAISSSGDLPLARPASVLRPVP